MDKAKLIFKNEISKKDYRKAVNSKQRYVKKFGDDSGKSFHFKETENSVITPALDVKVLELADTDTAEFDDKSIIIGNIRMGFGFEVVIVSSVSITTEPKGFTVVYTYRCYKLDIGSLLFKECLAFSIIGIKNTDSTMCSKY